MAAKRCVIVGPAFPLRGGIAQLNESLSTELTRQGIENVIFSFYMQYPSFLFPGKTQEEANDRKGPEGVRIRATMNSVNPISWWKTAKQIAAFKPDFIIVRFWLPYMGPCLGTVCRWAKQKLGVPVIGLTDNIIPHEKRIGDTLLTHYFVNQCDGFTTMSASVLEDLNQFDTEKPRKLLYHPVYDHFGDKVDKKMARKHLGIAEDTKVILFFGIIRKYKGLKLLIKSLARMRDKTKIKLIVAGEFYESREKYNTLVENLHLEDHVDISAGFVDKHKVKFYFCAADLVAQPYLHATQSGVTQIAYHFEIPMLVTNVGGLPEMVPHKKVGYVCERNPRVIADAIASYFDNHEEEEFKKNILEEKKRFSWKFFTEEIVKFSEGVN